MFKLIADVFNVSVNFKNSMVYYPIHISECL